MTDFKRFLIRLNKNLNILQERQAKYGSNVPLDLLNQIEDHQAAITLTEQAIAGEISEVEWLAALQPLLIGHSDWLGINLAVHLVLSQYAVDQGAELAKVAGPGATENAGQVVKASLDHLRQTAKGDWLASEFEQDPETYQKPIEKELVAALKTNADLVAQLKTLLEQYHRALQAHLQQTGGGVHVQSGQATVIQQGKQGQTIIDSSIGGDVLGPGASKR
jgi:hypothetical protein